MATLDDLKDLPERLQLAGTDLKSLLESHAIKGPRDLVKRYKSSPEFREEWLEIWTRVARDEGGKVSLTTAGVLLGATMGSIGIAGFGSAVGVPLLAILGLAGFTAGTTLDSRGFYKKTTPITLQLPDALYDRLADMADRQDSSVEELALSAVIQRYESEQENT